MTKRQKLTKLRSQIIDEIYKKRWEEVWFFPRYKKVPEVKGYLGTAPIMFVSINPSFGIYPSKPDLFYYRNLKKQGFSNAHLTDVFKIKVRNKDFKNLMANRKLLVEAERYLAEEMKIIKPKLIVGVGKSYADFYTKLFKKYNTSIKLIPHYAPQFDNADRRKKFRTVLRGIVREYRKAK